MRYGNRLSTIGAEKTTGKKVLRAQAAVVAAASAAVMRKKCVRASESLLGSCGRKCVCARSSERDVEEKVRASVLHAPVKKEGSSLASFFFFFVRGPASPLAILPTTEVPSFL